MKKLYCNKKSNTSLEAEVSNTDVIRVVKLKISMEEWGYCFHFSLVEVLDFVKYFLIVEISHCTGKQNKSDAFFYKCFHMSYFILKFFPQTCWYQLDLCDYPCGKINVRQCIVRCVATLSRFFFT